MRKAVRRRVVGFAIVLLLTLSGCASRTWQVDRVQVPESCSSTALTCLPTTPDETYPPDDPGYCHGGCPSAVTLPPEYGAYTSDGKRADLQHCAMSSLTRYEYWCGA